jgi:SAM-dependent methyltransferase
MNLQEAYYVPHVDYRRGSPHLSHLALHDRLVEILRGIVQRLADQGLPLRVLEVGAGHGGFTEPALAMGCEVTAVDMSGPSVDELQRRFGKNPKFRAVYDPDGTLSDVDGDYSLLMFVSVLHHIPDYMSFLDAACQRITNGGALLTLQDPAWYSRHRAAHRVDQAAYFAWRLGQGNLAKGIQTRLRRVRGILDETEPSDMVEYHVVRNGVDEEKILSFAKAAFSEVSLIQYWSSQLGLAQHLGERFGLHSYFGIIANEYRADLPVAGLTIRPDWARRHAAESSTPSAGPLRYSAVARGDPPTLAMILPRSEPTLAPLMGRSGHSGPAPSGGTIRDSLTGNVPATS